MALIYPVQADAPEPEDGAEPDSRNSPPTCPTPGWSRSRSSEDGDDACFGPLTARAAWDLAVDLDDRRPEWTVSVVPLHVAGTADELIELFED